MEFADSAELVHHVSATSAFIDRATDHGSEVLDLRSIGVDTRLGTLSWSVFRQNHGESIGYHMTNTVDFDVVLEGSTTLSLDDASVDLQQGDCVLIDGVPHMWRAGDQGCLLSVIFLGKERSSEDARRE
jgi:mannose-6-phosphate isomerase-like protein (cupin superfamily)